MRTKPEHIKENWLKLKAMKKENQFSSPNRRTPQVRKIFLLKKCIVIKCADFEPLSHKNDSPNLISIGKLLPKKVFLDRDSLFLFKYHIVEKFRH